MAEIPTHLIVILPFHQQNSALGVVRGTVAPIYKNYYFHVTHFLPQ